MSLDKDVRDIIGIGVAGSIVLCVITVNDVIRLIGKYHPEGKKYVYATVLRGEGSIVNHEEGIAPNPTYDIKLKIDDKEQSNKEAYTFYINGAPQYLYELNSILKAGTRIRIREDGFKRGLVSNSTGEINAYEIELLDQK